MVELDDEYKKNHEATTIDDDSQEVYKDDNTQVVSGANPNPSIDFFYEVDVAHKPN